MARLTNENRSRPRLVLLLALGAAGSMLAGCSSFAPPLSEAEVAGFTMRLSDRLAEESPPLAGKLTVEAAVQRALRFNHSIVARALEAEWAQARVRVEAGGMLPDILADVERSRRNKPQLSRSTHSDRYSGSSDLATLSSSIALSWSLLDFGLSYVRARQADDEAGRRWEDVGIVAARVIEDTRLSYWQSVALHTLLPRLARLDVEVGKAMGLSRRALADSLLDPRDSIAFQRDLLNLRREINDLFSLVAGADHRLMALIAAPPGTKLELDHRRSTTGLGLPHRSAQDDVMLALRQRPEIRQHMYDMRITRAEVDAAVLRVLPGLSLGETFNTDSTSFLLSNNWVSWSARLAANLIELVRLPATLDSIEAQQAVDRANALATAATIAMQVHVARARVGVELRAYEDAQEFAQAQKGLLRQTEGAFKAGRIGEQALALDKASALLAEIRAVLAFGDLHAALAAYEVSLGEPATALGAMAALQ